jgi:hypothetical protein
VLADTIVSIKDRLDGNGRGAADVKAEWIYREARALRDPQTSWIDIAEFYRSGYMGTLGIYRPDRKQGGQLFGRFSPCRAVAPPTAVFAYEGQTVEALCCILPDTLEIFCDVGPDVFRYMPLDEFTHYEREEKERVRREGTERK